MNSKSKSITLVFPETNTRITLDFQTSLEMAEMDPLEAQEYFAELVRAHHAYMNEKRKGMH